MYYVIFVLLFASPYISMLMLGLEKGSMIENSDNGTDLNGVDGDGNGDGDDGDGDDDVMWCDVIVVMVMVVMMMVLVMMEMARLQDVLRRRLIPVWADRDGTGLLSNTTKQFWPEIQIQNSSDQSQT